MEELSQDDPDDESVDVSNEDAIHNGTNNEVLYYFSRVTKHYLHLSKTKPDLITRHNMVFPIIADRRANFHMFRDKAFFETLHPATGQVIFGDGTNNLPIQDIGTIKMKIGENVLYVDNFCYVLDLSESIYSLFFHIRTPNHGLSSSLKMAFILFSLPFKQKLFGAMMMFI